MQCSRSPRSSGAVLFAFIVTAILFFGYIGFDLTARLADAELPDAKQFVEKGGSIETWRLELYHRLPIFGLLFCGAVGALAGWGFYVSWQQAGKTGD